MCLDLKEGCDRMQAAMAAATIGGWDDISAFLDEACAAAPPIPSHERREFRDKVAKGAVFYTYDYGIDGVSIEITKYAQCLENLFGSAEDGGIPLHFMGGDFYDKADIVLKPYWKRHKIDGMNGWSKWLGGEWFAKLYHEDMPEGSEASRAVAQEIWRQTRIIAGNLGGYLAENGISLVVPVNIPTNPGNLSAELALVIVSEMMGLYILSSNHDFYWEGGKPAAQKQPGEAPGPRDHFFKNIGNAPFSSLFRRLYPWNGRRWIQVNINSPQSRALVERFGFDPARVFELGTSISDKFFEEFTPDDQKTFRRKMAYILSDGEATVQTVGIREHQAALGEWMGNQRPLVCGSRSGLVFDPAADNTIYCLQPTRVIARKRIEMDFQLLEALMKQPSFLAAFQSVPDRQLVVHISGPVPIEHRADLETVLAAYGKVLESVPEEIAARIFLAFSVGTEDHPALAENGLAKLNIEEIYRLATVILFPSETEGRGLPIIESSAGGIPIICSRYYPEEVFAEVVGEHLPENEQIRYVLFPEDGFPPAFLDQVAGIMLAPEAFEGNKTHNKNAVRLRYSMEMVQRKFELFIDTLGGTNA